MPEYEYDIIKDISDLQREQAGQFSAGQKRQPITKASAGWEMPNRVAPQAPPNGAHIYAIGNVLRWKSADGSDYSLVPVQVPQAAYVDIAANMTAGATAPASYDQDYVTRLRDDVREVRAQLNALINSLRASGLLES